jgi:hypothetical protein
MLLLLLLLLQENALEFSRSIEGFLSDRCPKIACPHVEVQSRLHVEIQLLNLDLSNENGLELILMHYFFHYP